MFLISSCGLQTLIFGIEIQEALRLFGLMANQYAKGEGDTIVYYGALVLNA